MIIDQIENTDDTSHNNYKGVIQLIQPTDCTAVSICILVDRSKGMVELRKGGVELI